MPGKKKTETDQRENKQEREQRDERDARQGTVADFPQEGTAPQRDGYEGDVDTNAGR